MTKLSGGRVEQMKICLCSRTRGFLEGADEEIDASEHGVVKDQSGAASVPRLVSEPENTEMGGRCGNDNTHAFRAAAFSSRYLAFKMMLLAASANTSVLRRICSWEAPSAGVLNMALIQGQEKRVCRAMTLLR